MARIHYVSLGDLQKFQGMSAGEYAWPGSQSRNQRVKVDPFGEVSFLTYGKPLLEVRPDGVLVWHPQWWEYSKTSKRHGAGLVRLICELTGLSLQEFARTFEGVPDMCVWSPETPRVVAYTGQGPNGGIGTYDLDRP